MKVLIDSPMFIKTHLRQQILKPNSDLKLVLSNANVFSIDFNSIGTSQPQQLHHPMKLSDEETSVEGSCHGLVLIFSSELLWLCNPSTKAFRKLPVCDLKKPQVTGSGFLRLCHGLGYDSSSDDYKVVRTAQWFSTADSPNITQIMIYSLKSDSWRKVEECACWMIWDSNGVLVGGVLHWPASDYRHPKPNRVVIGLNLSSEKIQLVPFPENLGKLLRLGVLGECLCLLDIVANDHVLDHFDIWVMKDYCVNESWIKLFSVGQRDGLQSVKSRPIAYSENGREVLLQTDAKRFLWYNLETSSLQNAVVCGEFDDFTSFLCLGTLVPLHGSGNGNKKEQSIDQDKRGKEDDFLSKGLFKLRL